MVDGKKIIGIESGCIYLNFKIILELLNFMTIE